uniref:Uncharacterized protein n=1 Tax=Cucumis melo TaxID=3656 RepID=A0A9I9E9G0_CUCME
MFSCDFVELSIDHVTEILSLRLYGTLCTQVIFPLSMLSVLRDNDAIVSVGRAPLHRRTSKRWLYWACPTPRRSVMLVKTFDVEIELPVPDTLPTSAENSKSNSSTWLELYFESVHVEIFCKVLVVMFISDYFTNQLMSGLHLMYVGKVFVVSSVWCSMLNIPYLRLVCLSGLTFSRVSRDLRGDDVCWLHAIFRAKTTGGPRRGVTYAS